jgi:hypothetical protein
LICDIDIVSRVQIVLSVQLEMYCNFLQPLVRI